MALAFRRSQTIRHLYRSLETPNVSSLFGMNLKSSNLYGNGKLLTVRSDSRISFLNNSTCLCKGHGIFPWVLGTAKPLHSTMGTELSIFLNDIRLLTTKATAPPQMRQMGSFKLSMSSPGIVYEPYTPRESVSFWKRWFTRSGWKRTKDDIILELKSAYAIAKLRKTGYSKQKFYEEAIQLYKEINTLMANGNKTSLRKAVTENMYSALKNEIKQRESIWSSVYWELIEPAVKIRTLRARLIGVDRNDLNKVFIQLTLEFLTKQKFEANDSKGIVIAGDKTKEVLVRDIWVFEKSLFHTGAYWRLCGRISLKAR